MATRGVRFAQTLGIECYIKFCLSTTGILRLPDKRLPDGRRRLPASGRHCGMRIFISASGRRLCIPGPLLCLSAGACVFLAGYEARSHN